MQIQEFTSLVTDLTESPRLMRRLSCRVQLRAFMRTHPLPTAVNPSNTDAILSTPVLKFSGSQADYDALHELSIGVREYVSSVIPAMLASPLTAIDWKSFFESMAKFFQELMPFIEMIIKLFVVIP